MLIATAHELMQGEGDFVGMRCAPGNNALELDGIVRNGADFHQLGFDDLRVSHTRTVANGGGKLWKKATTTCVVLTDRIPYVY